MMKRAEDVIFGCGIIVFLSWLLFLIAVAIKLTSRGPVLFRQQRRGRNGTTFHCYKFRTMHRECTDQDCAEQTQYNDPRITVIGKFLRKHSLDELPQLFNVIQGNMSLVGPRPHALGTAIDGVLLPDLNANYHLRYHIRPGLTGWAQINGWRGILDTCEKLDKRVEYDLHYIANWSLFLDLKILLRTFTCLFDDERAY
jgi:lipopolysaccharide/colanic/teichoic acid biosynthesis glycosyltransferase